MRQNYFLGISPTGFHRVAYSEWGNESGVPVVCVHGLSRNRHDFDVVADFLSKKERHVFCPDVVGRGDSDWLSQSKNYTFEQYLSDMTALTARINSTKIDWIGTSMGGLIGMIMASMPQTPIRKLILNDIGPYVPGKALFQFATHVGTSPVFNSMEEAEKYIKIRYASFGNLTEEQWHAMTESSICKNSTGEYQLKMDPAIKIFPPKIKYLLDMLFHPIKTLQGTAFDVDLWEIWKKVKCPVLLIRGQLSDVLSLDVVKKMQQIHPHMETIEVPHAGHAPALMDLAQLKTIERWLAK